MNIEALLQKLEQQPTGVEFDEVMSVIDAHYTFQPTAFSNGRTNNEANTNSGSCKIFAFGLLNKLTQEQTLACFGKFYRDDVLKHPNGSDHANIRNFMITGWAGIQFSEPALKAKP